MAILVVLASVVVAVAVITGRGMVVDLQDYREAQAAQISLSELRFDLIEQETAFWRHRALGGTGFPLDVARRVLVLTGQTRALSDVGVTAETSPAKRAAISDTLAGLDAIVALVASQGGPMEPGSAADRRFLERIAPLINTLKASAADWNAQTARELETANAKVETAARRIITLTGATALIALLLGLATWSLVARSRRRIIGALEAATKRLRLLADTDPLTSLSNQRLLHDRLHQTALASREAGRPMSAIMIDLDHFKAVNDTYGHPVGDLVLVETADRLTAAARDGDLIARIGGEEFLLLLPDTDGVQALGVAERIRQAMGATEFPAGVGTLTASLGVATLSDDLDADGLLQQADAALYWAKTHGRDAAFRFDAAMMADLSPNSRARQMARADGLAALRALARAIDAKDSATQLHSIRVADMAVKIATALGWTPEQTARLREAGLVHDVGKIGIPDAILLKPGTLTPDERELMQDHARLGARIVSEVLDADQVDWVAHHHERWDGGGYPGALAGTDIPEGARILAVADSWDAMTSTREYSTPLRTGEALTECRRCSGTQFWPAAIQALERLDAAKVLCAPHPATLISA